MSISPQTINKIKGTIYGQVIGDALGLGAEFMSKEEVKENYPNGLTDYGQVVQDSHGCIAASVLGAKFGFDSIPKRWIKEIHNVEEIEKRVNLFISSSF